jgi:hypothetical protein
MLKVRRALESAGVEFVDAADGKGEGVRFSKVADPRGDVEHDPRRHHPLARLQVVPARGRPGHHRG